MRFDPARQGPALVAICGALVGCTSQSLTQGPKFGVEARERVAQAAEESGDYGLAESMFASAAKQAPGDAAAQLRYADSLMRRGDILQAREVLEQHVNTVANVTQLRQGLGALYVLTGEPANAIAEFDKILAANPNDTRAVVDKAVALDLLGRHAEAQPLYHRALAASPGDPVVINDLALSMMLDGHVQQAEALMAPLRNAKDVQPRIKANIGVVLAANGDAAAARDVVQNAAAQSAVARLARAVRDGRQPEASAKQ